LFLVGFRNVFELLKMKKAQKTHTHFAYVFLG